MPVTGVREESVGIALLCGHRPHTDGSPPVLPCAADSQGTYPDALSLAGAHLKMLGSNSPIAVDRAIVGSNATTTMRFQVPGRRHSFRLEGVRRETRPNNDNQVIPGAGKASPPPNNCRHGRIRADDGFARNRSHSAQLQRDLGGLPIFSTRGPVTRIRPVRVLLEPISRAAWIL
jgi:hypothetical protein